MKRLMARIGIKIEMQMSVRTDIGESIIETRCSPGALRVRVVGGLEGLKGRVPKRMWLIRLVLHVLALMICKGDDTEWAWCLWLSIPSEKIGAEEYQMRAREYRMKEKSRWN